MRLFFACPIPPNVARSIEIASAPLAASVPGVRWVSPDHMHLTMKFLGDRPDHDVAQLTHAAHEALKSFAPFEAHVGAAGAFPNFSRPRVVWLGMEPQEPFATIAERLEHGIAPLGYPPEGRPFTAHLTLGRIARPLPQLQRDALRAGVARAFGLSRDGSARDARALGESRARPDSTFERRRWRVPVREVVLFSSSHVRGVLRYDPLQSIPLGAR